MNNAQQMGFNAVFFQVRGAGTVYFNSAVEPWSPALSGGSAAATGKQPNWDPLRVAVAEGHRRGLQVHAYLNILPGWEGAAAPPAASGQLWVTRPSWFMVGADGKRMTSTPFYAFLNPALPEVRRYLASLCADMVQRYDVDGVHLDYIRWPGEKGDYSYDPATRRAFEVETVGWKGTQAAKWKRWRAGQIRLTLREIYSAVRRARPGVLVTAAVFADVQAAESSHCQWSWEWQPGVECDIVFPMNYASKPNTFNGRLQTFAQRIPAERLGMGLRAEHGLETIRQQIAACRQAGVRHLAFFAYADLAQQHQLNAKGQMVARIWP